MIALTAEPPCPVDPDGVIVLLRRIVLAVALGALLLAMCEIAGCL